jgi:hypothetical protein
MSLNVDSFSIDINVFLKCFLFHLARSKMPFPKKKSRKTNTTGRRTKDPEDTIAGKSDEEQKKYFRHAKRKSRGADQIETPHREHIEVECDDEELDETSEPTTSKRRGRPTLGDKRLTPNSYSERRKSQMNESYRVKKLSKVRSNAAAKSWQMRLDFDGHNSTDTSSDEEERTLSSRSENEEETEEEINMLPESKGVTERTERRYKQKLQSLLTDNPLVNLDIFVHYCKSNISPLDFNTQTYSLMGNMDQRQIRYRGDIVNKYFQELNTNSAEKILIFWFDILLQNKIIAAVFHEHSWRVPEQYAPTHHKVAQAASQLQKTFLKRDQTTNEQRILGTRYVAEVIKVSGLTTATAGGIQLLASHTNCSRKFAKAVMQAVESNELENFIGRKTRCDSIHADRHWVDRISQSTLAH